MATIRQQALHWRDRSIARSEVISDAWQVFLAYSGRSAEIVLFICMAVSLIQMIPTIFLPAAFTGTMFMVNMITLDVAGFGLNSLAKAVGRAGDKETAKKAGTVGTLLIIIMVISMFSGGLNQLFGVKFPVVKEYTGYLDDVLLLIRVVMTVLYGKIMHALRDSQQYMQVQVEDAQAALQEEIARLQASLQSESDAKVAEQARLQNEVTALKNEQAQKVTDLSQQLTEMKATLETRTNELSHVQKLLTNSSQNESSLLSVRSEQADTIDGLKSQLSQVQSALKNTTAELSLTRQKLSDSQQNESFLQSSQSEKELSFQAQIEAAVKVAREEMKLSLEAEMEVSQQKIQAEMEDLKKANSQLKAQMKEQRNQPVKQSKQLSSEKFDTRQFCFACFQQDPKMKFSDMAQMAKKQGQELSEPTVSRYRREYRETSTPDENESQNESFLG